MKEYESDITKKILNLENFLLALKNNLVIDWTALSPSFNNM
jgi:hypothetical protein